MGNLTAYIKGTVAEAAADKDKKPCCRWKKIKRWTPAKTLSRKQPFGWCVKDETRFSYRRKVMLICLIRAILAWIAALSFGAGAGYVLFSFSEPTWGWKIAFFAWSQLEHMVFTVAYVCYLAGIIHNDYEMCMWWYYGCAPVVISGCIKFPVTIRCTPEYGMYNMVYYFISTLLLAYEYWIWIASRKEITDGELVDLHNSSDSGPEYDITKDKGAVIKEVKLPKRNADGYQGKNSSYAIAERYLYYDNHFDRLRYEHPRVRMPSRDMTIDSLPHRGRPQRVDPAPPPRRRRKKAQKEPYVSAITVKEAKFKRSVIRYMRLHKRKGERDVLADGRIQVAIERGEIPPPPHTPPPPPLPPLVKDVRFLDKQKYEDKFPVRHTPRKYKPPQEVQRRGSLTLASLRPKKRGKTMFLIPKLPTYEDIYGKIPWDEIEKAEMKKAYNAPSRPPAPDYFHLSKPRSEIDPSFLSPYDPMDPEAPAEPAREMTEDERQRWRAARTPAVYDFRTRRSRSPSPAPSTTSNLSMAPRRKGVLKKAGSFKNRARSPDKETQPKVTFRPDLEVNVYDSDPRRQKQKQRQQQQQQQQQQLQQQLQQHQQQLDGANPDRNKPKKKSYRAKSGFQMARDAGLD